MYLFISLLICSSPHFESNEISMLFHYDHKINNYEDLDIMTILAEGGNDLTHIDYSDHTTEDLFEYLLSGGKLEYYKVDTYASTHQHIYDCKINNKVTEIYSFVSLDNLLNLMNDKFNQIKNEYETIFTLKQFKFETIIFSDFDMKTIKRNRNYLRRCSLIYECALSNYIEHIINTLSLIKSDDTAKIIISLNFMKDVANFIIFKKTNLSLRYYSRNLLDTCSRDIWKIHTVTNNICMMSLIDEIIYFCKNALKIRDNEKWQIVENVDNLRRSFVNFIEEKNQFCKRLNEICEIIKKTYAKFNILM
ncbi:uncharacterized protein VNE69_02112 [Vairimorpha necatrix]|uniref:Uncharacterized protein n=1 Tax=Vairimorpha necatrix TaxID=6039 RepID=A0AAX4J9P0_9MICR